MPDAEVVVRPLADGGEGTTDAFIEGFSAKRVELSVTGPLGKPVAACYGILEEQKTAVMEMASAAGITLLGEAKKNPLTATNDGGMGMLKALGYKFITADGTDVGEGGAALGKIAQIIQKNVKPILSECHFMVACDVTNPLCGPFGATYVYGPQKGVTDKTAAALDDGMSHYADMTVRTTGKDFREQPGAGAAGGMGFAFLSYLNAEIKPGADLVLDALKLKADLKDADIFITGEGRLDGQTAMGKAPARAAALAKSFCIPVIAFAGLVTTEASACNEAGIDAYFPILRCITSLETAMNPNNAASNMADSAEQVFRLIKQIS